MVWTSKDSSVLKHLIQTEKSALEEAENGVMSAIRQGRDDDVEFRAEHLLANKTWSNANAQVDALLDELVDDILAHAKPENAVPKDIKGDTLLRLTQHLAKRCHIENRRANRLQAKIEKTTQTVVINPTD